MCNVCIYVCVWSNVEVSVLTFHLVWGRVSLVVCGYAAYPTLAGPWASGGSPVPASSIVGVLELQAHDTMSIF